MAANGSPAGLVDYQMFINNKWVDAQSGETFESVNPYTGPPGPGCRGRRDLTWTPRSRPPARHSTTGRGAG
jgi:hypothetical protein